MIIQEITKSTATTKQFLNDIHGASASIYYNVGGKTWKNKPQTYEEAESKLKWLNNDKNKDIYFIPNSGGTKNGEINKINAVFIDWDAGKDEKGNYLPLETVHKRKAEFFEKLKSSPLEPTYVVDTRNGYQVYWLLYPGCIKEQFIDAQKRIAYYFKTDPVVITPCHVMRLPGYYWYKPHKNCSPYYVGIIVDNTVRYYISHILQAFPVVTDEAYETYRSTVRNSTSKNNRLRKSTHVNSFSYYKDSTLDNYVGTYPQNNSDKPHSIHKTSLIDQLKRQNLADYLEIDYKGEITPDRAITFNCLFHDDKTPSAGIFIDENGYYWYCCHSSECGFNGTIIDVVQEQDDIDTSEAVSKLIDYYGLEDDKSWIEDERQILSRNIALIEALDKHKDKYPDLYRAIGRVRKDLLSKLKFARDNVALKTSRNENIIICSLRRFHQLVSPWSDGKELGCQNERIDRYCLLGLMRKLHDDEINSSLLFGAYQTRKQMAKVLGKGRGKRPNMCRTQFYTIPEYTNELLERANDIAKLLKKHGIRMNAISRDLILQVFGQEKAMEIYPQVKTKETSEKGKVLMDRIEMLLLEDLEKMGYSKIGRLVERAHTFKEWRNVTDKRVKRYVPGLLKKHDLIEVISNKKLKNQLGIEARGYPKVIIRRQDVGGSLTGCS